VQVGNEIFRCGLITMWIKIIISIYNDSKLYKIKLDDLSNQKMLLKNEKIQNNFWFLNFFIFSICSFFPSDLYALVIFAVLFESFGFFLSISRIKYLTKRIKRLEKLESSASEFNKK